MDKTVSFYTLGCRSNRSETSVLKNLFSQKGFTVVQPGQGCDIAVINTCTVTEKGDRDSFKLVSKINRLHPQSKIALIGCQAQTQSEILKKLPNVRWIVGNAEKINLVDFIQKNNQNDLITIINPPIQPESFLLPPAGADQAHTRANLKIQEGCDAFCSFCEVPYARGPARSRDFNDLLNEAEHLANAGFKEIVLTGTNIGMYRNKNKTLVDVVKHLEDLPLLKRIRISSIEPNTIPYDLVLLMGTKTKLCRSLHISLQSGCDDIIRRMGRNYTQKTIDLFFDFTLTNVPDICLGADIIVGFPGETENAFLQTYEFLKRSPLAYFHTFSYSNRKFAKSRIFPDQIDKHTISQRSQTLRSLNLKKKEAFIKKFIGTSQKILFEQKKGDRWIGLTKNYLRVQMASNQNLYNRIVLVSLTGIRGGNLVGELLEHC